MATEEGEMNTNGNGIGIAENGEAPDVKPDIVKKEFQPNFEVKEEPSGDGDGESTFWVCWSKEIFRLPLYYMCKKIF